MKRAIVSALVALAALAPTAAVAQQGPFGRIEHKVIFLDEMYAEVGRWTYYCDGYVSEEGMFTARTVQNYYGCD